MSCHYRSRATSLHVSTAVAAESVPDADLNSLLQTFWEIESVPAPKPIDLMSLDDQECELHFQRTHSRDASGTYQVELPFKTPNPYFPGTFANAKLIFLRAEKRIKNNEKLRDCYHAFMREYIDLNHMSEIGNENSVISSELESSFFIPYHGIFQGNSSSPKFRVVFNASSKSLNGISLNDTLFAGPSLQTSIVDVLLKWRSHHYVYSADIQKM